MSRTKKVLKKRDPHALDAKMRHAARFTNQKKEESKRGCRGRFEA